MIDFLYIVIVINPICSQFWHDWLTGRLIKKMLLYSLKYVDIYFNNGTCWERDFTYSIRYSWFNHSILSKLRPTSASSWLTFIDVQLAIIISIIFPLLSTDDNSKVSIIWSGKMVMPSFSKLYIISWWWE